MTSMTFACTSGPRLAPQDRQTILRRGDQVRRTKDTAGRQIGTVLSVWPAQWSERYATGTLLAKVRFPRTWRRVGGGQGDAVVTMKASNLVPVQKEG